MTSERLTSYKWTFFEKNANMVRCEKMYKLYIDMAQNYFDSIDNNYMQCKTCNNKIKVTSKLTVTKDMQEHLKTHNIDIIAEKILYDKIKSKFSFTYCNGKLIKKCHECAKNNFSSEESFEELIKHIDEHNVVGCRY